MGDTQKETRASDERCRWCSEWVCQLPDHRWVHRFGGQSECALPRPHAEPMPQVNTFAPAWSVHAPSLSDGEREK